MAKDVKDVGWIKSRYERLNSIIGYGIGIVIGFILGYVGWTYGQALTGVKVNVMMVQITVAITGFSVGFYGGQWIGSLLGNKMGKLHVKEYIEELADKKLNEADEIYGKITSYGSVGDVNSANFIMQNIKTLLTNIKNNIMFISIDEIINKFTDVGTQINGNQVGRPSLKKIYESIARNPPAIIRIFKSSEGYNISFNYSVPVPVRINTDNFSREENFIYNLMRNLNKPVDAAENIPLPVINVLKQSGNNLLTMIFSPEIQQILKNMSTCPLTIVTDDLEVPWSALNMERGLNYEGKDNIASKHSEYLSVRFSIGIKVAGAPLPEGHTIRRNKMLLLSTSINELKISAKMMREIYKRLKDNAQDYIVELYEDDGNNFRMVDSDGRILNPNPAIFFQEALGSGEYSIIHYNGHGVEDSNDPRRSYLKIREDIKLEASDIVNFVAGRPAPFIIFSACETKHMAKVLSTANLQGFLGTLIEVNEKENVYSFITEIYNNILQGHTIGEAVQKARISIIQQHPRSIYWMPFVLYGDPNNHIF